MLAVWELEIWSQCNFEFRPLLIELMMYQGGCKMIGVARSSQKISSAPPYPFTKLINTMQNLGSQSISFKYVWTIMFIFCLYFLYISFRPFVEGSWELYWAISQLLQTSAGAALSSHKIPKHCLVFNNYRNLYKKFVSLVIWFLRKYDDFLQVANTELT